MRETKASASAAVPARLLAYRVGVDQGEHHFKLDVLPRVRRTMSDFLDSCPDYGSDVARLHGAIGLHIEHSGDLASWVAAVAQAFLEAGGDAPRPMTDRADHAVDPSRLLIVDDDLLAAQAFADSAAAETERVQARALADAVHRDLSHLDATRRDMAVLDAHRADVVFVTAFFNRLGPEPTVLLEREVVEMTRYEQYARNDSPDAFAELVQPLNMALATASRGGGLTSQDHLASDFITRLVNQPNLTPADLANLLQSSEYSTNFLVTVGRRLVTYPGFELQLSGYPAMLAERWPGVATSGYDPLVSVLQAIGNNPDACATLMADRDVAGRLLDLAPRTDPALIAFVAQQAAVDYPGNAAARNEAAFNVAAHFAARGNATPEMRHVLASIVVQHIEELALDADLPTNRPTNAAGGSMDFTLADLQQLLRLATTDPADMGRVLDATGAWAAAAMAVGAADQGTARVGRLYGVLASASDLQVRDAAAADEHRRRLIDSVDKVAGLIPVAGGPLVQAGVGAARVVAGEAVKGLAQTDETSVAVGNANAFNESMIRHLDYLAAAAALARDPARFSTRVAPPLVNDSGRWRLAREVEAPQEYRRWFSTYEGEFSETRSAMDTGYLVRGPRWTGH